jgi:hypothetical protein
VRLHRRIAVLLAALGGATGCGLPADDQVTTYSPDDLPPVLANTTTTSTSTTTVVPASTAPPPDDAPSTTSTTVSPVETEAVDVFYTLGFSDDLQRITLNLPSPVSIRQLTSVLEVPPPEVTGFDLRSALRVGLIVEVVPDRGIANVELSQDVLNRMTSTQERRSIAQIVLTLTSFRIENEGGIGQVRFTVDGEAIPVFLPAVGGDSEPGEPVAYADFGVLVTPVVPTTTTAPTPTSSRTTTTVPDTRPPVTTESA